MSKKLSIVLIILLSILLVLVVGGMVFLISSSSRNINIGVNTIGIHTGLSKKLVEEKEITNIKPLNIEFDSSDVFIKVSDTDTIKVELYGEDPGEYEITELDDSIKVVLKEKEGTHFKWGFNIKQNNMKIYLPKNYALLVSAKGTAGDITMEDFSSASIKAELKSGDIEIGEISFANLALTSGDIEIDSAYEVKSTSTSGDIDLGTVRNVEVSTTTGDISIDEVDSVIAKTTTGDYTIGIINGSMSLEATTGDVTINTANVLKNSKISVKTGDVIIRNINDNIYVDGDATTGDVDIKKNDRKSDIELVITTTTGDIIVK